MQLDSSCATSIVMNENLLLHNGPNSLSQLLKTSQYQHLKILRFWDFFHVELKKKYTTGSSRLSKRQLGLNTYTDCEQVFATLSRVENGENKDSSEESDLEVEILATGKTECKN